VGKQNVSSLSKEKGGGRSELIGKKVSSSALLGPLKKKRKRKRKFIRRRDVRFRWREGEGVLSAARSVFVLCTSVLGSGRELFLGKMGKSRVNEGKGRQPRSSCPVHCRACGRRTLCTGGNGGEGTDHREEK